MYKARPTSAADSAHQPRRPIEHAEQRDHSTRNVGRRTRSRSGGSGGHYTQARGFPGAYHIYHKVDHRARDCADPSKQAARTKAMVQDPQVPSFGAPRRHPYAQPPRGTPYVQPGTVAHRVATRTRSNGGAGAARVSTMMTTLRAHGAGQQSATGSGAAGSQCGTWDGKIPDISHRHGWLLPATFL